MKPTDLRPPLRLADEIELLREKLEFADFEWHRAIEAMQERDNRIVALEAALREIDVIAVKKKGGAAPKMQQVARAALDKDAGK